MNLKISQTEKQQILEMHKRATKRAIMEGTPFNHVRILTYKTCPNIGFEVTCIQYDETILKSKIYGAQEEWNKCGKNYNEATEINANLVGGEIEKAPGDEEYLIKDKNGKQIETEAFKSIEFYISAPED